MASRRLPNLNDFNVEDMIFPEQKNVGNFKKTMISTKHSDGTSGKLISPAEECFSLGVQKSDRYDSYSMPLVLKNDGNVVRGLKEIIQQCKQHVSEEGEFGNCLYERNNGTSTVYSKLGNYQGEFSTKLFESGVEVDPLKYLNARCNVRAAVGVESILVGNSVSLQLKVYEAEIKPLRKEYKRLLPDVTKKTSLKR